DDAVAAALRIGQCPEVIEAQVQGGGPGRAGGSPQATAPDAGREGAPNTRGPAPPRRSGAGEGTQVAADSAAAARGRAGGAARQVATVTALVPLALADVMVALSANIRMIRRIAEIYGGRAGTLGSLRLTRAVLTHLVATGAIAVGDDVISSVAGASLLSKV